MFFPSGATSTPSGALMARPNVQPTARRKTRQPVVPCFWTRAPVDGERLNEVTLLLRREVTYACLLSEVSATEQTRLIELFVTRHEGSAEE